MKRFLSNPPAFAEKLLHRLSFSLSALTLCLLFVGAMVTSTNSGLSVPDWPTTFGQNMFAFPLSAMRGGIFYEHGHRLFASAIGTITVLLTLGMFAWERRRWVRKLSLLALVLVCAQGVLGGMTVRFKLPIAVSSAHAGLAELFFCTTLWLAWATSSRWKKAVAWRRNSFSTAGFVLMALVFVQIMVGAVMRHSYAGLAIPTFPLAFGSWIPNFWSSGIVLNFLHTRVGPGIITAGVLLLAVSLLRHRRGRELFMALSLITVLGLQIALGIWTVWSGKAPWVASLHLAGGACVLGTLFTITLWSGFGSSRREAAAEAPSTSAEVVW